MKTVQYNPSSDTVVLPSYMFRELLERCGELEPLEQAPRPTNAPALEGDK